MWRATYGGGAVAAGWLGLALFAGTGMAATPDAWITTKAKIALLTTDGVPGTAINVDTITGQVTLHGTVGSHAEKRAAEAAVRGLDGRRSRSARSMTASCCSAVR